MRLCVFCVCCCHCICQSPSLEHANSSDARCQIRVMVDVQGASPISAAARPSPERENGALGHEASTPSSAHDNASKARLDAARIPSHPCAASTCATTPGDHNSWHCLPALYYSLLLHPPVHVCISGPLPPALWRVCTVQSTYGVPCRTRRRRPTWRAA